MTNALLFFNHGDFFGVSTKGEEVDVVSIIRKNAKILYKAIYDKGYLRSLPEPGSPELPWENEEKWRKLKEIKAAMTDCQHANHYITPEISQKFYTILSTLLADLHRNYFKFANANPFYVWKTLLESRYAFDLANLFFWLASSQKLGIDVYLMSKEEFEKDYENNPKLMKELVEKIDIHVTFDLEKKYDFELASKIIQEGKVIVGHDEGGHSKVEFSFIPFMLNKYWEIYCKDMPEIYLEAVKDFVERYDGKMAQLIPPFVSIPCNINIDMALINELVNFFKKTGCTKIIVKGADTAANKGSSVLDCDNPKKKIFAFCPYLFLDIAAEPETWLLELNNYVVRYGLKGYIMLQAVVRDSEAKQIEERYEEAIVHKTTVVGDIAWRRCVKTIYYFLQDFWKTHDVRLLHTTEEVHYALNDLPQKEEVPKKDIKKLIYLKEDKSIQQILKTVLKKVEGVLHKDKKRKFEVSDLEEEFSDANQKLDMAGEFINLISPMGAHALDIVFGKIEEKGEREMYLLEANGSNTRSDPIPMNEYTGKWKKGQKTMFDEYMEWALNICNGNPEQAGAYTRKIFSEVDEKKRAEYLKGVEMLWEKANTILTWKIAYCSNGGVFYPKYEKV